MLTRLADTEPRLQCRRHAVLVAAAILGIVLARCMGTQMPLAVAFASYGALHGAALSFSLRPLPAAVRALVFVAAAALLSGSLARLGLSVLPRLAGTNVMAASLLVVALSGLSGALGYGVLLRSVLRYRLAPGRLVMIALGCMLAASAALVLVRQHPAGGSAWLAILWWLAFSGGLCAGAGRARSAPDPTEAAKQRM